MDKYILIFIFAFVLAGSEAIETLYLDDYCGGTIDVGLFDQIELKLTRDMNYHYSSWQCEVQLTAEYDGQLMLYFYVLYTPLSDNCEDYFLELDDGSSRAYPYISGGKLCGFKGQGDVYTTSGQYLTVYFSKDSTLQYAEFDMTLTSYHTGECDSSEYECSNGRCIDESINCNGNNPCGDYSDCQSKLGEYTVGVILIDVGGGCALIAGIVALILVRRQRRNSMLKERTPIIGTVAPSYGGYNQSVPAQYAAPPPPYTGQIQQPSQEEKGLNQSSA